MFTCGVRGLAPHVGQTPHYSPIDTLQVGWRVPEPHPYNRYKCSSRALRLFAHLSANPYPFNSTPLLLKKPQRL